ncbi:uncharacterized protein LOC115385308 isoform X2 [Xyrichtys novacula]|uniref:Uncharacterized protein LOC115385308 isoform X2 n=1 Tax=Xyrichtys novacula TaxID=13765 RepID=A0AAV1HE90_XYRNO|nr:uncharacterized protein LOC115385308 isoform X2 [Xyrichtys novacula]
MVGCAAFGCTNRSERGHRMYGFPKGKERQKRWLAMVSIQNFDVEAGNCNSRKICQVHFEDSQFISTKKGRLRLRHDAVPTLFGHHQWPTRGRAPERHTSSTEVHLPSDDHNYCTRNDFGAMSLDYKDPDFVPSVFSNTTQNQNPEAKIQGKEKKAGGKAVAPPKQNASKTSEEVTSMDQSPDQMSLNNQNPVFVPSLYLLTTPNQNPEAKIQGKEKQAERIVFSPSNPNASGSPAGVTSMDHSPGQMSLNNQNPVFVPSLYLLTKPNQNPETKIQGEKKQTEIIFIIPSNQNASASSSAPSKEVTSMDHSPGQMSLNNQNPVFVPSVLSHSKPNQNPEAKIQGEKKRAEIILLITPNQNASASSSAPSEEVTSMDHSPGQMSLNNQNPVFVPSVKQEKKEAEITLVTLSNQNASASSSAPSKEVTSMDHSPAKEDNPCTKKEYDDLNKRYARLENDHINLLEECQRLRDEHKRLKEERTKRSTFSYSSINTVQLLFFTGITSVLFDWLCTKINGSVKTISTNLSLQDHLLIVLMKLRQGLTNTDLAFRFDVSTATLSRILRSWLPALAIVLKPLITWPSKGATLRRMPRIFHRKFKRCRCILARTKISINRPSIMTSRSRSWSNSKHNNTMKYLIGITPAGAISFLSKGWSGWVSDKRITKESGFYDLLESNDEILADRGVLSAEELAARGATLREPALAFTKSKKQLSAQAIDTSRQLACVRIHIEQVMRRLKNFRILQTRIPVSQVDFLDDVVVVCAALTNLRGSVD